MTALFRTTKFDDRLLEHRQSFMQPHKNPGGSGVSHRAKNRKSATSSEDVLSIFTDPRLCGSEVDSRRAAVSLLLKHQ